MKFLCLLLLLSCATAEAADFTALCADRAAVEKIYYQHRTGEKPPFEQALPRATLEQLVRTDLQKETVLKQAYGIEITAAQIDAEVRRINTTTRAPGTLAELKAALDNDPARFAQTVARPILVERELRNHFDNDDKLHAAERQQVEQVRAELLAAKKDGADFEKLLKLLKQRHSNEVNQTTWQLAARPTAKEGSSPELAEIQKRFGPNAQLLSSPQGGGAEQKFYFDDLPPELQNVLRAQLRQPGDVSAVIETPGGFLLYTAKDKTTETLSVAALSLPKRSYEQWLQEQAAAKP